MLLKLVISYSKIHTQKLMMLRIFTFHHWKIRATDNQFLEQVQEIKLRELSSNMLRKETFSHI